LRLLRRRFVALTNEDLGAIQPEEHQRLLGVTRQ
jgi:hypothetical protein